LGSIVNDTVVYAGLTLKSRPIGVATGKSILPHDGIIGFADIMFSHVGPNPNFFLEMCADSIVSSCNFGFALNSNGTGQQFLGEIDSSIINETSLVRASLVQDTLWFITGNVTVNGTVVASNQTIELDSGTATVVG
jgi:hypothetical protein